MQKWGGLIIEFYKSLLLFGISKIPDVEIGELLVEQKKKNK